MPHLHNFPGNVWSLWPVFHKKSFCEPESPLMFSLSTFSPTDSPTLLLGYKNPTFPGCIWSWAQSLSGITECHDSTPTSVHPQWSTRMNTSLTESMKRTPHTPCLNCGTHGGYSPVGSGKESPDLTFLPPFCLMVPPLGKHARKWLMTKVAIWGRSKRSASHKVLQSRDGQTVLWGGVNRINWYCSE